MSGETYRSAGVDIEAGDAIKEAIHGYARLTYTPRVLGKTGLFAGLVDVKGYHDPVLVASTDSVGTKLKIGVLMDHYESLGVDLVNQSVNDVLTTGARPLFFLDYVAMSPLDARSIEGIIKGVSLACRQAGCALIGGETAELPGIYQKGAFDLVGFVVGVMERGEIIDGASIRVGDALLGIPSSGLHTNGFSLVRKVFRVDDDPSILQRRYSELGRTLGDELLVPHRAYFPLLEPVFPLIKGMAHITGGGLVGNVPRVLPEGLAAHIRRGTWRELPIFRLIQEAGNVAEDEMLRVFNMGLGMVLVVSAGDAAQVQAEIPEATVIGEVVNQEGDERVILES